MTHYNATPGMVNDLPAPVPGAPPGTRMVVDDPSAVQSPGERMRGRVTSAIAFPATPGMRDDDASAPVPGSAPLPGEAPPQDPAVAAYTFDLPEGFQADEASLGELKALAVQSKLEPATTSRLVALHAKALAAEQARLDADIAGWAEKSRALPEWTDPQRPAALEVVRSVLPPSARTWLESTAFGSHPEVVRMVLTLGKELLRLKGVPAESGFYRATPGMRD
jgi:hypothetical protein